MRDNTESKYCCENSSVGFFCDSGERHDAIGSCRATHTYASLLAWALPPQLIVDCFSFNRSQVAKQQQVINVALGT